MLSTGLGALLLAAGLSTSATAVVSDAVELSVVFVDTTGITEAAGRGLKDEVAAIYAEGGVGLRWLDVSSNEQGAHVARVYLMEELPPSVDARLRAFGGAPMGLALGKVGDASGPVIYVSRDAVAEALTGAAGGKATSDALGKALGRIVAHELAHRFLQRKHTRRGILAAELGGKDLVSSRKGFFFTADQRARLRQIGLRRESDVP